MEEPTISFVNACLACLASNRIMESVENSLAGRKISDMLKCLLPSLEISVEDVPFQICMLCKNNLILAYDFQQMLIQSDVQIKKTLSKKKTEESDDSYKNEVIEEEYIDDSFDEDEVLKTEVVEDVKEKTDKTTSIPQKNECPICHKVFSRPSHLTRHAIVHTRVENPQEKRKTPPKKKPAPKKPLEKPPKEPTVPVMHFCDHCDKSFPKKSSLKEHMRTHFPHEKPFLCPICGKAFNLGSSLRHHVKIHGAEKKHVCTYCPSKFLTKAELRSHLCTHTGEKRYFCPTCSKGFAKSHSLKKHIRTHTGERPYPCTLCAARFNSSNHLKRHVRTHTGEKPYKCTYCTKSYAQSNELVKHLRTHVGNTYKCDACSETFRLLKELKQHKNDKHYLSNGK